MLYTEKEKHEIERVKEVFAEHLRQSPDFELLWSDKVGYQKIIPPALQLFSF